MRLKTLQSEIESALIQAQKIQLDYPDGSLEHDMLKKVVSSLQKALASFSSSQKPEEVKIKRKK